MKKILCSILAMVMLFSTFSCLTFTASAANDVVAISFTPAQPIEVIEAVDGSKWDCWWYSECEQCDGVYFEYSYGYNGIYKDGNVLTVSYSDGSSVEYTYDDDYGFVGTNGDIIYTNYVFYSDEQYLDHWNEPGEYSFTLNYEDCSTTVPITVIENPVKSIYYTPVEAIELMELVDGDWTVTESEDTTNEEYFEYDYECKDGDTLTVKSSDNTSTSYVFDNEEFAFVSSNGDVISPFDVLFYSNQSYDNQWIAGGAYKFVVSYSGRETSTPVKILENPVDSIYFKTTLPSVISATESEAADSFFWGNSSEKIVPEDSVIVVKYRTGEELEFSNIYSSGGWCSGAGDGFSVIFSNGEEKIEVECWTESLYGEPVPFDCEHELSFRYMGREFSHTVTVVECDDPIKSISYTPVEPLEFIEFVDGYWDSWDEEGDSGECYLYPILTSNGDVLTVNYTDGSSVDYIYDNYEEAFIDSNGNKIDAYDVEIYSNQSSENQWIAGGTYKFVVSYSERETSVPVKILENPVEKIYFKTDMPTTISATEQELANNYFWMDAYEKVVPEDSVIVVKYRTGEEVEFKNLYSASSWGGGDSDGFGVVFGNNEEEIEVNFNAPTVDMEPLEFGNEYDVRFEYMGRSFNYTITIEEATECTHSSTSWETCREATVYRAGEMQEVCSDCGEVLDTQAIPQLECSRPVLKKVANVNSYVKITWGTVKGADSYKVYRKTGSGSYEYIGSTTNTYFNDKEAGAGKSCRYIVRAENEAGNSEASESLAIKHIDEPTLKSIENSAHGVLIKWDKVTGAEKYNVYRKVSGGEYKYIGATDKTYYTDKTAKSGTKYYYAIRGKRDTSVSSQSASLSKYYLADPTLKSIENSAYGVLIKWDKVTGAEKYSVYRKVSGGEYKYIGATSNTYYTDKTAKSGTKYYYAIRAKKGETVSALSNTKSIYHLADPTLNTPTSTTSGIKLSWSKVTGAEGYMVYRKTGSGSYSKIATVKGSTIVTYTDKSAKKGKKYTYKIKAYKSKTYSAYSNTKTITDKY